MDGLRIGDADRDAALALLGEQYAQGRLTKDELDERSDAVWSARTRGDLAPLFADLPVRSPAQPVPAAPPAGRRRPRFPVPLVAVLVVLGALTVLTHLPFVLVAVALWFVLGRRHWHGHRRYAGPGRC